MTRDEFMLQRLKDDAATNRRTYPILLGCVIAFVVMTVLAFMWRGAPAGLGSTLIMVSIALRLPLMKQQRESYDIAIRELEAHIADPSKPLSETTLRAISTSDYPAVELFKGWIGLAVCAAMLIAMGVFFLVLIAGEGTLFLILALGCILGGIVVCFPTIKMYRSWKVAKALEEAGL